MSDKSKSTISLGMLPMDKIAAYLQIVENFSKSNVNAVDTDAVGGIPAQQIAVAYSTTDRNTVKNAMQLNGIEADQYLKKDESTTLLNDTYNVSNTLSNELKEVRDEMYQLKAELAKAGYIKHSYVYDGFYEAFKNNDILYNKEPVTKILGEYSTSDTKLTLSDVDDLVVKEYVSVKDTNGNMYVQKIKDISGKTITLEKPFGCKIYANSDLYKYAGQYYNGEYIFGKDSGMYLSDQIQKNVVKDGKTRTAIYTLNDQSKGFASRLSNYYSTYGGLIQQVEFSLSYTGNPGNIRAHIYKVIDDSNNISPICELLGISESVYPSEASNNLSEVKFNFIDPVRIAEGSTYIIALYCGGATENDTWKIGGYTDPYDGQSNLFYVDDTYAFNDDKMTLLNGATDSYIALYLAKEIKADVEYNNQGLYSKEFEVDGGFTRARVEMKVNREGLFYISSDSTLATTAGNSIHIIGDRINPFFDGDKVVVGQMHSVLSGDCSANNIQTTQDLYTPFEADVYRVGYKVFAKCYKRAVSIAPTYEAPVYVELPLTAVLKGKESDKEAMSSDRLIFEGAIQQGMNTLTVFDKIEIQIVWNSPLQLGTINNATQYAGKILDLTVTTDKAYIKGGN